MSPKTVRGNAPRPSAGSARTTVRRLEGVREETTRRILDAAKRVFAQAGVRDATMEEVAREARLTRMTVYRYFASRDELGRALIGRELRRYLALLAEDTNPATLDVPAGETPGYVSLVRAFLFSQRYLKDDPVLTRILEREPDLALPFWTTQADAYFQVAVPAFAAALEQQKAIGWIGDVDCAAAAEWMVRLGMSWFIAPSVVADLHDPATLERMVREFVWPVLAPTRSATRRRDRPSTRTRKRSKEHR